jgi:hypothetical protein
MYITKLYNCQLINLAIFITTEEKMSIICYVQNSSLQNISEVY